MKPLPRMKPDSESRPDTKRGPCLRAHWKNFAATLAIALLAAGCGGGGGGGPEGQPPVAVDTISAGTAAVEDRLSAVGTVLANEEVVLKPKAAGRVAEIKFDEGRLVHAGDVLISLDDATEQAQLQQARAELELARQNLERASKLSGTRAISVQELDRLGNQVALKEAQVRISEERQADMHLRAPMAGVLGPRLVSPGQFVPAGEPLVTLTDAARVKVTYRLPEKHLAVLQAGQRVMLRVAAYGEREFPAVVDLINPQVDPATRTAEVRAIAENPGRLLKPGMFARLETVTGLRENALVIPERAVVPSLTGFSVYVVTNQQARLVPVELGTRLPGKVEIRKGINAGEEIVVNGIQKLIDGSAVVATPATNLPEAKPKPLPTAG
ncbi:MAG TPA: efflux transporter periplasmic adaptor subunit [Verrucomicrobiales bacterium]|nr:efflux transporter periplasmic adaptor subunit [Verrucomicrobiales bacterium]